MSVLSARRCSRLISLFVVAAAATLGFLLVAARAEAAFPGGNGKIAYQLVRFSSQGVESKDISVMDADGSKPTQLTTSDDGWSSDPAWSPDGTQIAFSRLVDFGVPLELWIMDADGSNPHRIPTGVSSIIPAWSPDATKIAFTGLVGNSYADIFTVGVNGGGVTNLTQTPSVSESSPTWSPDGHTIAFQRNDSAIYAMNADGTNMRRLYQRPSQDFSVDGPAFSPDGARIAFAQISCCDIDPRPLLVMDADGSDLTVMPYAGVRPTWSPDGQMMLFDRDHNIFSTPLAGGQETQLSHVDTSNTQAVDADWQPLPLGPYARATPAAIAFPDTQDHLRSGRRTVTLTNIGSENVNVGDVAITGADATSFTKTSDTCIGATLAPHQACSVTLRFRPLGIGAKNATLSLTDNAPKSPQTVTLSGTGTPGPWLERSPQGLKFGHWRVGTTAPAQSVTLTNVGSAGMHITAISVQGANPSDFPGLTQNCLGLSHLAPGQSCTAGTAFRPTAIGTRTATLTIVDTAPRSPHRVTLAGTGT
jgi:hypothetical protein